MSTPLRVSATANRAAPLLAIGLAVVAVLAAGSAKAQSASGTLSSYRAGYGGISVTGLESPVSPSLISSSSQFAISDGVNQAGSIGSAFTSQSSTGQSSTGQSSTSQTSGGAGQSATGVGQGAVSNARAPFAVVESTTANTASAHAATTNATATSDLVLNGKLNLDGGQ